MVRGRLWRRSDPALTPAEHRRRVAALMRARRAVRTTASDRAQARAAVECAKRALGERGAVWWTDGSPDFNRHLVKNSPYAAWYAAIDDCTPTARRISAALLDALRARAADASVCPSEIARRLSPGRGSAWRALMPAVRAAVARLCKRGRVRATRGAKELKAGQLDGGPIRIRRGPKF